MQLFARLYGTNHINNCSYYCHQASGVALTECIGTGTATLSLEDLEPSDFVVLSGANPASYHPRLMTVLKNIRRKGGEVIVINPLKERWLVRFRVPSDPWSLLFGTKIASQYLQIKVGGDIALYHGISKSLIETNSVNFHFIESATEDFENLKQQISRLSWETIVTPSGRNTPFMVYP